MAHDLDWDERGEQCRSSLQFLHFLCGHWVGEGRSRGEPVHGRFRARLRFEETFLQCEETLRGPDGELGHQDLAMMRYDPDGEVVRVTHFMARGWVSEQLVRPLKDGPGAFWYGGPFTPRVVFRPSSDTQGPLLEISVILPEQDQPDTVIRYRPDPASAAAGA